MKKNKFLLASAFMLLASVHGVEASRGFGSLSGCETLPMEPELRYGVLPNGLTYYVRHNEKIKDRADFYIVQNVGAILEEDSQNGLAHFLEHMAFQGTKHLPGKMIINYLETVGVKFGKNINAYTSLDETVYNLSSVPTTRQGIIDTALLVLHDWSCCLSLDNKEIDNERGVIREEWRTRNTANRRLWTASLPVLFPNSQYAKRNVIGDTAVINNFAYDTLKSYYYKWYRPDQQAIIIVGDLDADALVALIRRMFADIPKRVDPAQRVYYTIADNDSPIVSLQTDPEAKGTLLNIDFRHSPDSDCEKSSLPGLRKAMVRSLLQRCFNSRLDEVTQKAGSPFVMAQVAYGDVVKTKDAFSIYAQPAEGRERDAFDLLLKEAEKVRRYGFTGAEYARAAADLLSMYETLAKEKDKRNNESFVDEYKRHFLDLDCVPGIEFELQTARDLLEPGRPSSFNRDSLNRFVSGQFFSPDGRGITVSISGPERLKTVFDSSAVVSQVVSMQGIAIDEYVEKELPKSLVERVPKPGKIKSVRQNKALGFEEWTLSNGMRVVLKPTDFKKDEINLRAFAMGGASLEDDLLKLPSAKIADDVVDYNGLGQFDAVALRKALSGKVVQVSPFVSSYEHGLDGGSRVADFETMAQLFYLYFTGTRTDDNGFSTLIEQYRTVLTNRVKDPGSAFSDSVNAVYSGHNARCAAFDTVALGRVEQKDALGFFKRCFANPADFTVVLTGNIDAKKHRDLILTYFGGIRKGRVSNNWVDRSIRVPQGQNIVNFKRSLQTPKVSNFIAYTAEVEPSLKNIVTLQVVKNILYTRYLESMREKFGGTYGVSVRGGISCRPVDLASLQMSFDTDPDREGVLLPLIEAEIDTIIAHGPLASDLEKSKQILVKDFNERVRENGYWEGVITTYCRDNRDEYSGYASMVQQVSAEDVVNMLWSIKSKDNRIEVVMLPE